MDPGLFCGFGATVPAGRPVCGALAGGEAFADELGAVAGKPGAFEAIAVLGAAAVLEADAAACGSPVVGMDLTSGASTATAGTPVGSAGAVASGRDVRK
jgi:hypothetical protein